MTSESINNSAARDYLLQAKDNEQLALVSFSPGNDPKYLIQPSADSLYLPYLIQYLGHVTTKVALPKGDVICSLHDAIWSKADSFPKLAFGREINDQSCYLIPDPFFIKAEGYADDYMYLERYEVPWEQKKSVCYFRGSSTGGQLTLQNWKKNRRVRLGLLALEHPEILDIKVTHIIQEEEDGVADEILKSGISGVFEPPETCVQYRYLVDIDGNANSWGYFLKLAMGSVVFKVESLWEEWFYSWIKPWVHYIPVKADLSDLVEKIEWARANDRDAQRIAFNGREFARSFTYDHSLQYGGKLIADAIIASNSIIL